MKTVLKVIICCQLLAYTNQILACSFAPGYGIGEPYTEYVKATGPIPEKPEITEISITRGHDDGNYASCSDAGILTIVLSIPEKEKIKSYEIVIVKGQFPDQVIPNSFVTPIKLKNGKTGFNFVWLDVPASNKQLEPIDVLLMIKQVSYGGQISEPAYIRVADSGINK